MTVRVPCPAARRPLLGLAAVALVLVAGCTSERDPVDAAPTTKGAVGAAATSSAGAELQAALAAVLVERTYAVAAATEAVADADARITAPEAAAALAAIDATSLGLAEVLGATFSEARAPLLEALRREDQLLTEHAVALAQGDAQAAKAVREQLRTAEQELAVVIRRVVPKLDADEVVDRLGADVRAQLADESYERLRAASAQAVDGARLLAAGIAADRGLGSPSSDAARVRTDLTSLLVEHTALSGALARELREADGGAVSARAALQSNAVAIADALGDRYPAARDEFLRSWRGHLDRLQAYAAARAGGGDGAAEARLVRGYPPELGRLLAEYVGMLPGRSAQAELEPALVSLLAAIDAAAADSPAAPRALQRAVAGVLPAAALVSAAVAEDLRLR